MAVGMVVGDDASLKESRFRFIECHKVGASAPRLEGQPPLQIERSGDLNNFQGDPTLELAEGDGGIDGVGRHAGGEIGKQALILAFDPSESRRYY